MSGFFCLAVGDERSGANLQTLKFSVDTSMLPSF